MTPAERDALAWEKGGGLIPAIVQHADDARVLMLGYLSREALDVTLESGRVTFWSRSRRALWTKGETSGNVLKLVSIAADCDRDTLLIRAQPDGPVCHAGTETCFPASPDPAVAYLARLDALIRERERERPRHSYTTGLFAEGIGRIAQKVGEEAVETALAAVSRDADATLDEAADLAFHLLVLLRARGLGLGELAGRLAERHRVASTLEPKPT